MVKDSDRMCCLKQSRKFATPPINWFTLIFKMTVPIVLQKLFDYRR